MPNRCFIPNCNSGFPGCSSASEKVALFAPPTDSELFKQWCLVIPRKDAVLKPSSRVCSRHFSDDDVVKGRWLQGKEGQDIFYPWKNWCLKKDAIPRLFPGTSFHFIGFHCYFH